MNPIDTDRLHIRNFTPGDGEALYDLILQFEASGMAAYDQAFPTSPSEIQQVAEWFASGDSFLAVCLKDSGKFIGFVALNPEGEATDRTFNLGYNFDFAYHGKGYATEACRAMLDYAFNHLEAQQIVSGTAAVNQASCRLLEKLGFRITGEHTGSFRNDENGKPIEFLGYAFSLSKEDWNTLTS